MTKKTPLLARAFTILLLLALPLSSPGKVFFSRLTAKGASVFDNAGWRRIYQAPMVLNNGRLTLSVYGCDEPFSQVMTRLKQAFKSLKETYLVESPDSAYLANIADNQVARALAVALPDQDKSLIFSIAQSQSEFSKSSALPAGSGSFGETLLPDSILNANIRNEDTGAMLETRSSAAPPENVTAEIAGNLRRNGWKLVYPPGGPGTPNRRFMVFQRSTELCVVLVGQAAAVAGQVLHEKKTCVTIINKRLKSSM